LRSGATSGRLKRRKKKLKEGKKFREGSGFFAERKSEFLQSHKNDQLDLGGRRKRTKETKSQTHDKVIH